TQGDYRLQPASPSIDAGDNQAPNLLDTDLDGNTRILDGDGDGTATVDMGVDEFLAPPSEGISLIESRLKKAAVLNLRLFAEPRASSWTKTRATKTVPVPAHRSPDLPAY
ncbi:MAG TPA: choice-of-anchor Q domain-containing protein, partial [Blastocatellia bacterium]|nr:choice-of-anchor Q domain-containing protein [Blastocatellia bacterium]